MIAEQQLSNNGVGMILPGTEKEIINEALEAHSFSLEDISQKARVSLTELTEILAGSDVSDYAKTNLVRFYLAHCGEYA